MDIHLPFHSGLELIKYVRTDLKLDTPVLSLTAFSDPQMQHQSGELGISGYIVKPFNPTDLIHRSNLFSKFNHEQTNLFFIFGIFLAGFLLTTSCIITGYIDPESEYLRIRKIAFEGDYATAALAARKLVNSIHHTVMHGYYLDVYLHGKKIMSMQLL